MKKRISVLLFLLINACCFAQTAGFRYSADLGKIERSGFYNIVLTPDITARLKTDQSDIRVVDSAGRWIPHVLEDPSRIVLRVPMISNQKFRIVENSLINTTAIVEPANDTIYNLIVEINNSAEQRFFDLSGSNDRQNWFVINDSILPDAAMTATQTTSTISLGFPPVHYNFIRIRIHNGNRDPFGIVNIGTMAGTQKTNDEPALDLKIISNPPVAIQQKDSGKISYIKVTQPDSYLFSYFKISVSGPKYFSRDAGLYVPDSNHVFPGKLIRSFTLTNNSTLKFGCEPVKAKTFYIVVHNADNLPVIFSDVSTGYHYMYLSTYMEEGKSYRLFFDDPAASKPDYDLSNLSSGSLYESMPFLSVQNIKIIKQPNINTAPVKNNKFLLWLVIILILCLLLFFTSKMLKETNKRNDDNL